MADFYDLLSPTAKLGDGHIVGVQGSTGTGRSVFTLGAPDPILYINTDLNAAHAAKHHPQQRVLYANMSLALDETKLSSERRRVYDMLVKVWNGWLNKLPYRQVDPDTGEILGEEPFRTLIWDTHSHIWDFIYPMKVDEAMTRKSPKAQESGPGPLDYRSANEWMWALKDAHKKFRPEANMVFILAEKIAYVPDPEKPNSTFRIPDPRGTMEVDGWKNAMTCCDAYIRLYRRSKAPDRDGKEKRNVRYGELLKFTPDESYVTTTPPIAEPVWGDLEEMFQDVTK